MKPPILELVGTMDSAPGTMDSDPAMNTAPEATNRTLALVYTPEMIEDSPWTMAAPLASMHTAPETGYLRFLSKALTGTMDTAPEIIDTVTTYDHFGMELGHCLNMGHYFSDHLRHSYPSHHSSECVKKR